MRKVALALLFLATTAHAQYDDVVKQVMSSWKVPGVAVGVVKDDRVVYLKAFGDVTPDTLFEIASTSKAFTTAAMAMLVDEKKLSWDDPVRNTIPYFHLADPQADALVTLRDLVTHRTGLARHDELWDETSFSREEVIRRAGFAPLTKPIRTTYQYNNIMFAAAGEAVASASGMPWEEFVRTRIFVPLSMTHTRVTLADWNASNHTAGHHYDAKSGSVSVETFHDYSAIAPAGTIKSCASDMTQWLRFQLANGVIDGKRLVSATALQETKNAQIVIPLEGAFADANPETNVLAYGMGWNVQDYRGTLMNSHAGALNGFRTQVTLLPKQHAGIVVLTNADRGRAAVAIRNTIADRLLGGAARDWNAYELEIERKSDERDAQHRKEVEAKRNPNAMPTHDLAAYAGTYRDRAYGDATVTLTNGTLVLQWQRLTIPLVHSNYDAFTAIDENEDVDEVVRFMLDADGKVVGMSVFGEEFARQ